MNKIYYTLIVVLFSFVSIQSVNAQMSQMGSAYFRNQYQANPAFAGMEKGLNLNLGYLQQWSNMPGSPIVQAITADYSLTEKAGLGLSLYNDLSGLFKRTRAMATYAYHLPLNSEGQNLSFGLSLGVMNERISNEDINGDQNDMIVGVFNQRESYIDGDFGMAYTGSNLQVQVAFPNMKSLLKKDFYSNTVGHSTFFSAISYKLNLEGPGGFGLEPKLVYRGRNGMDNVLDAGANLSYANNKVNFFGMYHSSKSSTFGIGLNYQNLGFSGMYSTANSGLSNYSNGNFELSLKLMLLRGKLVQ